MTPEQADAILRASPLSWWMTCGQILNKKRQWITPVPNIFQIRMFAVAEYCVAVGRPIRLIALKPRRVGGTTAGAALMYHCARRWSVRGICIADTNAKSDLLFAMVNGYADHDALDWGDDWRSTQRDADASHGSQIFKGSAEAPRGTRGDTLTAVHKSEVAWWRDVGPHSADETAAALSSALAEHAETLEIDESTPKGASGYFYSEWLRARWPDWEVPDKLAQSRLIDYWRAYDVQNDSPEASDKIRVFAAWHEFPEYSAGEHQTAPGLAPLSNDDEWDAIMRGLSPREERGMNLYGWTAEQIKWRRWMIRNKCFGQEARFDEEYPENPTQCFLASGSPVFATDGLATLIRQASNARPIYGVVDRQRLSGRVIWRNEEERTSWAVIYEHPIIGCRYNIGVDVMTGESDVQGSGDNLDRHAVIVVRKGYINDHGQHFKPRVVARIKPPCQIDNTPLAEQVAILSEYYGRCQIVVEANRGGTVIAKLRDDHGANLYQRQDFEATTNRFIARYGFLTTGTSRDILVDAVVDVVRDGEIDCEDMHIVGEMQTFIRDKKGKRTAASGCKDDDVIALGLALATMDGATPMPRQAVVRKPMPQDYQK